MADRVHLMVAAVVAWLAHGGPTCASELSRVPLDALVAASDLIVEAEPDAPGKTAATCHVKRTHKGKAASDTVVVDWSDEPKPPPKKGEIDFDLADTNLPSPDRIKQKGELLLLFLHHRKDGDAYRPTFPYGAIWHVSVSDGRKSIPFGAPLGLIDFPASLKHSEARGVPYKALVKYLEASRASP